MFIRAAIFIIGIATIGCGGERSDAHISSEDDLVKRHSSISNIVQEDELTNKYKTPEFISELQWINVNDTFYYALGNPILPMKPVQLLTIGSLDGEGNFHPLDQDTIQLPFGMRSIDSIIHVHRQNELFLNIGFEYFLPNDNISLFLERDLSNQKMERILNYVRDLPYVSSTVLDSFEHPMIKPDPVVRFFRVSLKEQYQYKRNSDSILIHLQEIPGIDRATITSTRDALSATRILMKVDTTYRGE